MHLSYLTHSYTHHIALNQTVYEDWVTCIEKELKAAAAADMVVEGDQSDSESDSGAPAQRQVSSSVSVSTSVDSRAPCAGALTKFKNGGKSRYFLFSKDCVPLIEKACKQ